MELAVIKVHSRKCLQFGIITSKCKEEHLLQSADSCLASETEVHVEARCHALGNSGLYPSMVESGDCATVSSRPEPKSTAFRKHTMSGASRQCTGIHPKG